MSTNIPTNNSHLKLSGKVVSQPDVHLHPPKLAIKSCPSHCELRIEVRCATLLHLSLPVLWEEGGGREGVKRDRERNKRGERGGEKKGERRRGGRGGRRNEKCIKFACTVM